MKSRLVRATVLAAVLTTMLISSALAWQGYNVSIPWFGGWVVTNNILKETTSGNARIVSSAVSNGDTIYGIVQDNGGNDKSAAQTLQSGTDVTFPTQATQNMSVHLKLANSWSNPNTVQAIGSWTPDAP